MLDLQALRSRLDPLLAASPSDTSSDGSDGSDASDEEDMNGIGVPRGQHHQSHVLHQRRNGGGGFASRPGVTVVPPPATTLGTNTNVTPGATPSVPSLASSLTSALEQSNGGAAMDPALVAHMQQNLPRLLHHAQPTGGNRHSHSSESSQEGASTQQDRETKQLLNRSQPGRQALLDATGKPLRHSQDEQDDNDTFDATHSVYLQQADLEAGAVNRHGSLHLRRRQHGNNSTTPLQPMVGEGAYASLAAAGGPATRTWFPVVELMHPLVTGQQYPNTVTADGASHRQGAAGWPDRAQGTAFGGAASSTSATPLAASALMTPATSGAPTLAFAAPTSLATAPYTPYEHIRHQREKLYALPLHMQQPSQGQSRPASDAASATASASAVGSGAALPPSSSWDMANAQAEARALQLQLHHAVTTANYGVAGPPLRSMSDPQTPPASAAWRPSSATSNPALAAAACRSPLQRAAAPFATPDGHRQESLHPDAWARQSSSSPTWATAGVRGGLPLATTAPARGAVQVTRLARLAQQLSNLSLAPGEHADTLCELSDGSRVPVLGALLATRSVVFRQRLAEAQAAAMASGSVSDAAAAGVTKRVVLPLTDAAPAHMRLLLEFAATGGCQVPVEDAVDVAVAAARYDLPDLAEACSGMAVATLTLETALHTLVTASARDNLALCDEALLFVAAHAAELLQPHTLVASGISPSLLAQVLQLDNLAVPSERWLYDAVVAWAREAAAIHGLPVVDVAAEPLRQVRLGLLSIEDLTDVVLPQGLVDREQLLGALAFCARPTAGRAAHLGVTASPRSGTGLSPAAHGRVLLGEQIYPASPAGASAYTGSPAPMNHSRSAPWTAVSGAG